MFSLLRLESRFSVLFSTIAVVFKCLVYYVWSRALVFCFLLLGQLFKYLFTIGVVFNVSLSTFGVVFECPF